MRCMQLLTALSLMYACTLQAEVAAMRSPAELKIACDRQVYAAERRLIIHGSYRTWVNCGSQLAIWAQFPREVEFEIVDLASGQSFVSASAPLSVSHHQSTIEYYGSLPCDQMVEQAFTVELAQFYFQPPAATPPMNIVARFLGTRSNVLLIEK